VVSRFIEGSDLAQVLRASPPSVSDAARLVADGLRQLLAKDKEKTPPQWYVNGQGQTMVLIPGPVDFLMGSPKTEGGSLRQRTSTQEADQSHVRGRFEGCDHGTVSTIRRRLPNRCEVSPHSRFAGDGDFMVSGGGLLQLVEPVGGHRRRPTVLRDQRASDEVEAELPGLDGLSSADGSRDGVCDSCGSIDESIFWRDGRPAAELCVVLEELARTNMGLSEV
jgi:hypothetical protein